MGLFPTFKPKNWPTCRPSCSNTSCASLFLNMSTFATFPAAANGYMTSVMEGGRSGDTSTNSGAVIFICVCFVSVCDSGGMLPLSAETALVCLSCTNVKSFIVCLKVGSFTASSQAAVSRWHSPDAPNSLSHQVARFYLTERWSL